jgi:DNA helicase II / ATP-dependent DNA helicase PcrA
MAMGQKEAIKKAEGPCVILAGAGTGKTYTIVEKIKYLISNGIYSSERIVCITFSNEAANNLLSRVRSVLDFEEGKEPIVKTFHAFSSDLLRKYGDRIGINKEFRVLTPDDAKVILHRYLKVPVGNCHKFIGAIGNAKDLGISLENMMEYVDMKISEYDGVDLDKRLESLEFDLKTLYLRKDKKDRKKEIAREVKKIRELLNRKKFVNAWKAYEKLKTMRGYLDYSDLNRSALRLLENNKDIAEDFDYIVVDEFQDTNKVQLDLLKYLSPNRNITVVGDLNQSIYRFRGAYNKNFNEFKHVFDVGKNDVFNLDKSFRSPNKVLKAAHKLILNNYSNEDECFEVLNVDEREGEKVEVCEVKNAREEARKIVELVKSEIEGGKDMREICVMFRTHQQGRVIKRALEFAGLPFISVTRSSLLKEKSIKTVVDYLSILDKLKRRAKGGGQAWWDLIYQLSYKDEDLIRVGKFIRDNRESENLSALMLNSLEELELSDDGRMASKIMVEKIKRLIPKLGGKVPDLVKEIYAIGGLISRGETKEEKAVMKNLNKFFDLAKEHGMIYGDDLSSFIHYIDILDSLGIEIQPADIEEDGIRLMTLHATKGLEYKTVIITNMAQKRFPMEKYTTQSLIPVELSPEFDGGESDVDYFVHEQERKNQMFEERRLCYVAFTRAKEKLILTYAREYGSKKYYPSQFLQEVSFSENSDFDFKVDSEESYEEPLEKIGVGIDGVLKSKDFDSKINEVVKNSARNVSNGKVSFSPSSLLLFQDCQKKYEYRYVYNMPEPKSLNWEVMLLGSFVHRVLEMGVKLEYSGLKEFENLARKMHMEPDWEGVDISDALHLVKVFYERHRGRYNGESRTEQILATELGGINFRGFADRVDFDSDGISIVDYKTGRSNVPPRSRDWQMGYYALAASSLGKVKRITLEMLRHEKPLEFVLDDKGNARAVNSSRMGGFNIYEVEGELVRAAHSVLEAYKKGFNACSVEKNCEFCNEYVYGG